METVPASPAEAQPSHSVSCWVPQTLVGPRGSSNTSPASASWFLIVSLPIPPLGNAFLEARDHICPLRHVLSSSLGLAGTKDT